MMLTDGSAYGRIFIGRDFVEAGLLSKGKLEPKSHGSIRLARMERDQPWSSTLGISETERLLRRAAKTRRVVCIVSQAEGSAS